MGDSMRAYKLILLLSLTSFAASAGLSSKIYKIMPPIDKDQVYLILTYSGDVFEVSPEDSEVLNNAFYALENNLTIDIETNLFQKILSDKREKVKSLSLLTENEFTTSSDKTIELTIPTPLNNYLVNTVDELDKMVNYFKTMNPKTRRRSQCYNRAHMWSYELSKKFQLNMGKIWLFFSSKYIREYKYKWWFHVAPYLDLKEKNSSYVMDRSFTKQPTKVSEWTNIFMYNNATCKEVEYYSDYRNNQNSAYCFVIKSSMYYWQPFNIEGLEEGSPEKVHFDLEEVERAYQNAARGWDGDL